MNKIKDLIKKTQVLVITLMALVVSGCRSMGAVSLPNLYVPTVNHYDQSQSALLSDDELEDVDASPPKLSSKSTGDTQFSLLLGRYIHRDGVLRKLGNTGPTFGVQIDKYTTRHDTSLHHGWFLHWSFDHFFDTNSKLLKPKFWDESYTNYMLGGGYSLRWMIKDWVQLYYHGGLAINYLEIDTSRTNSNLTDQEATDNTLSTIHRAGISIGWEGEGFKEHWFGPSLLWYWVPNPLAKFGKDDSDIENTGGSLAFYFDIKWAF